MIPPKNVVKFTYVAKFQKAQQNVWGVRKGFHPPPYEG